MQLSEIPKWMEQFIPEMTNGEMKTKAELEAYLGDEKSGMLGVIRTGVIVNWNNTIDLLEKLKASGKLVIAAEPAKSMRIDWDKVHTLLADGVDKTNPRWSEVVATNICLSWYNFML